LAKLSLSRAWDETKGVLSRDGKLIAAVALALLVLPGTLSDLVTPGAPPGEMPEPGAWMIVALVALLIGVVGQLAIVRLATTSGLKVGDSIRHGAIRAPSYVGAAMIWVLPFGLAFAVLMPRITQAPPDGAAALGFLLLLPVAIFIFVRLSTLVAVASQETSGPLTLLRRSWQLSRGNWWRLFAFILICAAALLVLYLSVGAVIGSLVSLFVGRIEPMSLAALLVALATQLVTAIVTVGFLVMLARIYLQLAGPAHSDVSVPSSGT
jgi:hypothetical protein